MEGQDVEARPAQSAGEEESIYKPFDKYLQTSTAALLGYSPINVLLVFTPVAFFSKIIGASDAIVFLFALLALIPLAALLGFTTEELAMYTNQTIGGLMNATFGNATEVSRETTVPTISTRAPCIKFVARALDRPLELGPAGRAAQSGLSIVFLLRSAFTMDCR
jgi:hypothetical protein